MGKFAELWRSLPNMANERTHPVRVELIRKLMEDRNISQGAMAKAIRMSKKTVQNILNNESDPYEETLVKIAAVLGVKWRTLVDSYNDEEEENVAHGGVATKTTVDLIIDIRTDGMTPEKAKEFLLNKLSKSIDLADVIRVIILRDE